MRLPLLFTVLLTVALAGCSAGSPPRSTAALQAATADVDAQTTAALAQADAAIARADQVQQLTAGVDSQVQGRLSLSDAEYARRAALAVRTQAHDYALMAGQCAALASNVDDPREQALWRQRSETLAAKSRQLLTLAERYAAQSRKLARE